MSNYRKIVSLFLVAICFFSLISSTAFAASNSDEDIDSYHFVSVDDETGLVNAGLPSMARQATGVIWKTSYPVDGNSVVEEAVANGHSTLTKQRVRYLTSSWAYASSYSWSKSNTASWSFTGTSEVATKVRTTLGLSYSRTTNYTITINIPANSSKLSKLGFASDFFKQNYKYYMYTNGVVTVAENSHIKTPLADTYLLVYYK